MTDPDDLTQDRGNHSHADADSDEQLPAHLPQFLSGNRQVSLAALREKIETQFIAETETRPDLLIEADDAARRELIREVVDYVLAVESITLSRAERLSILELVWQDLFELGPLAPYLADETVTELTIDGPDRIHIRHGAEEMLPVDALFDDGSHLERIIQRVLSTAHTQLSRSDPVVEVATILSGRPARLTVFGPPISAILHVDIRLHPRQTASLAGCIDSGLLTQSAAKLLSAVLAAGHGLMIVGDVGTGKTTLLEALLPLLPSPVSVVERASELRLPPGTERHAAIPPAPGVTPVTFAEMIDTAVANQSTWLALDELRFDEAPAMWRAITSETVAHCLWVFRGATDPLRLRNAFSMSVRRAVAGIEQDIIHSALLDRLPFVALLVRQENRLKLLSINEWQLENDGLDQIALRQLWPASNVQPGHQIDWTPEP